jgi:hypothetical protein
MFSCIHVLFLGAGKYRKGADGPYQEENIRSFIKTNRVIVCQSRLDWSFKGGGWRREVV